MCDILKQFDLNKFKNKISLSTDQCKSYTRKNTVNDSDIILTIAIPYEYFICWYDLRQSGKLNEHSFNEILNAFISQHGVQLNASERINGVLRRSCGEIRSKYRKLKGGSKVAYLGFIRKISVYNNDIVKVTEIQNEIIDVNKKVELLSRENEREELWTQIGALRDSNISQHQALDSKQKEYDTILNENNALSDYLEKVGIFYQF